MDSEGLPKALEHLMDEAHTRLCSGEACTVEEASRIVVELVMEAVNAYAAELLAQKAATMGPGEA